MVEKYAEGIWRLLDDSSVIELADILCVEIDPGYKANRELRYSKYAQLDLSVDRKSRASMN